MRGRAPAGSDCSGQAPPDIPDRGDHHVAPFARDAAARAMRERSGAWPPLASAA